MKLEEATERCKELIKSEHDRWIGLTNQEAIKTVLQALKNSIPKEVIEREIEKVNEEQERMIDLMAYRLFEFANLGVLIDCSAEYDGILDLSKCPGDKNCVKCIKEYFKKKASE